MALELERVKRENARLQQQLEQAKVIISVQEKLAKLLGRSLPEFDDKNENNE